MLDTGRQKMVEVCVLGDAQHCNHKCVHLYYESPLVPAKAAATLPGVQTH